jgi:hypothetical protein
VTLLAVGIGCTSSKKTPEPSGSASASATATPAPTPCALPTATDADKNKTSAGDTAAVTDVRYSDEGCPRIVFQFSGHVPGYKVGIASPPFSDCGSGEKVNTSSWNASAYMQIRLEPSGGVDLSKSADPTYKGPRDISVDGNTLKHLKVTCDFEAVFTWVVGVDAKHPFNVQALDNPPRLVIDVSQTSTAG